MSVTRQIAKSAPGCSGPLLNAEDKTTTRSPKTASKDVLLLLFGLREPRTLALEFSRTHPIRGGQQPTSPQDGTLKNHADAHWSKIRPKAA